MRVILVFFDTMRYDHASFNGYWRKTTPVLDELAQEATIFTNCYATDVPTQPCYTATFTGQRGIKTGVVTHGQPEETIPSHVETFPTVLARKDILTTAVSTLYRFRRWFAQGFVYYIQPNINKWLQYVSCEDVNKEALPWIRACAQRDFFLFLHYWDPHEPYNSVPKRYLDKFYSGDPYDPSNRSLDDLRSRHLMHFFISGGVVPELKEGLTDVEYPVAQYDAQINYADEHFGDVLNVLKEEKILDDTIIIFTADHGEALRGEHGVYFDHMDAYEQVSHVPLFIWSPGRVKAQTVSHFVQHTDIAPTVLEAFGVDTPEPYEGRSLWPILQGKNPQRREFAVTNQGLWSAQRAYRTKQWTLVRTYAQGMLTGVPDWELFDRSKDRAEIHDVSSQNKDAFEELKARYLEWVDREVGGKPDPLRIAAEKSSAANNMKRRYEQWLAAEKGKGWAMGPKDRGHIDDQPAEER